jgi:hypothetical protein
MTVGRVGRVCQVIAYIVLGKSLYRGYRANPPNPPIRQMRLALRLKLGSEVLHRLQRYADIYDSAAFLLFEAMMRQH